MILEAAFICGLALLTLSYSVFAWYIMNRTVSADGMQLLASTPTDIQISLTGEEGTWTEHLVIDQVDILETVYGYDGAKNLYIKPASSYEGRGIFKTDRALLSGAAYSGTVFDVATGLVPVENHYEGYFVDIPLFFRTSAERDRPLALELPRGGADGTAIFAVTGSPDLYKTARVAFLSADKTADSAGGTDAFVLCPQEAIDSRKVITSSVVPDGAPVDPVFLAFTDGRFSDASIFTIPAATYVGSDCTYHPIQITLRIWIEGQDNRCVVGVGNQSFAVSLRFSDPTLP